MSIEIVRPSRETDLLSQDIRAILAGWAFDPNQIQVRVIAGDDGTEKIQMRIDLGLLQMEINGRPDGQRPNGSESILDYKSSTPREALAGGLLVLRQRPPMTYALYSCMRARSITVATFQRFTSSVLI